jgi:hypothetical protein
VLRAARAAPATVVAHLERWAMKKRLPNDAAQALLELEQFVYQAAVNWESYWSLDSKSAHSRFRSVFRQHEWWYGGARDAYFMCAIIALAKFFETNALTTNIGHFAQCLSRSSDWSLEHQSITRLLSGCDSASRDVALLRSNYYAHKNRNLTFSAMFKKTSLRYDDIPVLIQKMADMLNVAVTSLGGSEVHPQSIAERTRQEMESLLVTLQR